MCKFEMVFASDYDGLIGVDGKLPWHIPEEISWFKELTMGHIVVMGRKTFQSIGRPLRGRKLWILSEDPDYRWWKGIDASKCSLREDEIKNTNVEVFKSMDNVILKSMELPSACKVFFAGGKRVFQKMEEHCECCYQSLIAMKFYTPEYITERIEYKLPQYYHEGEILKSTAKFAVIKWKNSKKN